MNDAPQPPLTVDGLWERARAGDIRGAASEAREAVVTPRFHGKVEDRVELYLIAAFCEMRQGQYVESLRALESAAQAARTAGPRMASRVDVWRAELAYFQGLYSSAIEIFERVLEPLVRLRDWAYVAFALRIRIAIHLARAEYAAVEPLAPQAIAAAERSGDDYVMVQILNILGAVHFDCATSKLTEPHARSHLSALDPQDALPMQHEAREALRLFEEARAVAERAGYKFAAWYVAGNIERLEILLGHADRAVRAIRKRLVHLQARGAKYDEIVTRSNLAWALRTLGHFDEALHELDTALALARQTGTANVLLEFLYYDRSVVLHALGDVAGAAASYRRYVQLTGLAEARGAIPSAVVTGTPKRPLEPFFLKRADRYIQEHIGEPTAVAHLARQCGVSVRTLQKSFNEFRGTTPVAHMRNLRLDRANSALLAGEGSVGVIAARFGFHSVTTFSLEYRKRFGVSPRHRKRAARRGET